MLTPDDQGASRNRQVICRPNGPHPYHKGGTPNTHQTFPIFHKSWFSHPYPRCLVKLKRRSGRDHDGGQTFLARPSSCFSFLLCFVLAAASLLLLSLLFSTPPMHYFFLTPTARAGSLIRSDLGLYPSVVQICLSLYIRFIGPSSKAGTAHTSNHGFTIDF